MSTNNKGFSLVELVVTIAIMAVMLGVLAPALLQYTEKSRAAKDTSAMGEVVNSVQLAMSNQGCYDEVVKYSTKNQVSCYIDKAKENEYTKTITKEGDDKSATQYTFDDDTRLLDETRYYLAGNMRGVTITFYPSTVGNNLCYDLENGCINQWVGQWNRLENLELLYSSVRSTIGDEVILTSQTYRNSEFTIFIRIGTMGGNDASSQDAVKVYGQFSGTNLDEPYEPYEYTKASAFGERATAGVSSYFGYGEIEFEDGMTWEDWINSDYNTIGVKLTSNGWIEFPGGGWLHSLEPNSQGVYDYASGSELMASDSYVLTDEISSPWE